jgi:hypothetical protein
MTELGDVWCSECDQPATRTDALCDTHRLDAHEPRATLDAPSYEGGDPIIACACGWKQDWQHTQSWLAHYREVV